MAENPSAEEFRPQEESPQREQQALEKTGYVGSVLFFKHMIFIVPILCLLIPTVLALIFGISLRRTKTEMVKLQQSVSAAGQPPAEASPPETGGDEPSEDPGLIDSGSDEEQRPEVPAYQELYPELYAQPAERNSVNTEKIVYLTFDDGPSARTEELLEILDRYDVKATFFVVNKGTEQAEQWMRDIVEAGHTLGVHSYSHDYDKIYSSVEAYLEDFNAMYNVILEATGVPPQVFRFPGGSVNAYNASTYQEIISEMVRRGFVYFDWNRQTGDAVRGDVSAKTLVKNALDGAENMRRIFMLAHDSARFANVVEAMPEIIEGYQEKGFTFGALTAEVKPVIYNYPR